MEFLLPLTCKNVKLVSSKKCGTYTSWQYSLSSEEVFHYMNNCSHTANNDGWVPKVLNENPLKQRIFFRSWRIRKTPADRSLINYF